MYASRTAPAVGAYVGGFAKRDRTIAWRAPAGAGKAKGDKADSPFKLGTRDAVSPPYNRHRHNHKRTHTNKHMVARTHARTRTRTRTPYARRWSQR